MGVVHADSSKHPAVKAWCQLGLAVISIAVEVNFAHASGIASPLVIDERYEPPALDLWKDFSQPSRSFDVFRFDYGFKSELSDKRPEKLVKKSGMRRDARFDEGRNETWAGIHIGPVRIKASLLESTKEEKNKHTLLSEYTKTRGRLTVKLPLPGGSFFSVSYRTGSSDFSPHLRSSATGRWLLESAALSRTPEFGSSEEAFIGSFYHETRTWQLELSSTYSSTRNELAHGRETLSLYNELSAWARPTERLTISPMLGFWQNTDRWSGVRDEGMWAAPTVTYGPFLEVFKLKSYAYYDTGRSSDASWDSRTFEAALGLVWRPKRFSLGNSALLFQVGYDDYHDRIDARSSNGALFGGVHFGIHPF